MNKSDENLSPAMQKQFALQRQHEEHLRRLRKGKARVVANTNADAEPDVKAEERTDE
jgi:hypothetical protein